MKNKFKIGDSVKALENHENLIKDRVYTIGRISDEYIYLKEIGLREGEGYFWTRFEPINKRFCIKTNNQSEKLAALLWLSRLTGQEIDKWVYTNTINGRYLEYNYVYLDNCNYISSSYTIKGKDFEFSELVAAEKYYNNEFEEVQIQDGMIILKENHLFVGCNIVEYSKLKEVYEAAVKAGRI